MATYRTHVTYPTGPYPPHDIDRWAYYTDVADGSDIADRTAWMATTYLGQPEPVATGPATYVRTERVNAAKVIARQDWDEYDPWGSALAALFGMCDALSATGNGADIPASCGYSPAFDLTVESIREGEGAMEYLELILGGDAQDYADLLHTLGVVNRYADIARANGLDY